MLWYNNHARGIIYLTDKFAILFIYFLQHPKAIAMKTFDAVIIGAGQAGVPLAKKLAAAGWHTALVEKKYVGGTCVNTGCTPTKTLIASGQTAYVAAHAQKWGVEIDKYLIDMPAVKKRKDDIVINGRKGIEKSLKETENLELIYGTARFTGEKTLQLQYADGKTEEITADKIFINTGAKTAIPKIDGLDQVPYLTSDTIQDLESVPEHLLIVGAGYISLEFAQLYRRLGSEVTILENAGTFLAREDDDIANNIKDILEEDGINIILNAAAQSFSAEAKKHKSRGCCTRQKHGYCLFAPADRYRQAATNGWAGPGQSRHQNR